MKSNLDMERKHGEKFATRNIILIDEARRSVAVAAVANAPLGIEIVLREPVKARKQSQNAMMWAGAISDIANQAWIQGRQYSAETLHEHFKREFLPEEDDPDLPRLVKDCFAYQKWAYLPGGDRVCVGSTTQLSVYGFGQYLEQVYAFGAELGVLFSAAPGNQF